MYQQIDGPSVYGNLTVTTTAQEVKVGGAALEGRKVIAIQSLGNTLYIGFDNSVTSSTGLELRKRQVIMFESSDMAEVWVISDQGAGIDVRIWELG